LSDEAGGPAATIFMRMEVYWEQVGGFLWWRRWSSPSELPHGFVLFEDGVFDDFLDPIDVVAQDVSDWSHGRFRYGGRDLQVEWLDDTESLRVRNEVFGLGAPELES